MTVDLTGIAAAAITGAFTVLGAVLLAIIQSKIKNAQMASLLSEAVKNSLGKIQNATIVQVNGAAMLHPTLSPNLAVGVQYVVDHAPEAMSHFDITPDAIADKIVAQIGLSNIATNLAVSANATPAIAAPLSQVPVEAGTETAAAAKA
jgi:hypothetical protein